MNKQPFEMQFLHGGPPYLYGYRSGVFPEMPKDAKPYAYFDWVFIMETFNIKEAGKALEKILREELGSESLIRLTIDVQIPQLLRGDRQGFYNSISEICTYLNRYIKDLNIDIELLKIGQYVNEVTLKVDVKGSYLDRQFTLALANFQQDHISGLLKILPYPTKFYHGDQWLHFSFFMTFQYSGQIEGTTDIFQNKKVLLAEENELSALTFITLMEEWGCRVTKVSGALPAFEKVKYSQYDIILITIHSPEMHGIEVIQKIRSFDQYTPIIGLTSPWSKDYESDAYAAGVNDILAKPVGSRELQIILRKYI